MKNRFLSPWLAVLVPTSLALSALATTAGAQGTLGLDWKGATYAYEALPEDLPQAARSAVESWIPWAQKRSYRMVLEDEGRTLLLTHEASRGWKRKARLVQRTLAFFEEHLPLPSPTEAPPEVAQAETPAAPAPPSSRSEAKPGELPEDPDGGPAPWEILGGRPQVETEEPTITSWVWGSENLAPDSQTAVFLVARTATDYTLALSHLAASWPYLKDWVREASAFAGCSLQQPLFGTYVEGLDGQEEWSPDNELVHRTAELLLLRRFGQQPYWIVQGWAWCAELALLRAVYCYPYRNEFVWAAEHTDWDKILRNRIKARKKEPLSVADFARWRRGSYDDTPAKVAWGLMDFLLREHPAELPRLLLDLRDVRDRENRVSVGNGEWERRRDYRVPLETQQELLFRHFGPDVLERARRSFLGDGKRKR